MLSPLLTAPSVPLPVTGKTAMIPEGSNGFRLVFAALKEPAVNAVGTIPEKVDIAAVEQSDVPDTQRDLMDEGMMDPITGGTAAGPQAAVPHDTTSFAIAQNFHTGPEPAKDARMNATFTKRMVVQMISDQTTLTQNQGTMKSFQPSTNLMSFVVGQSMPVPKNNQSPALPAMPESGVSAIGIDAVTSNATRQVIGSPDSPLIYPRADGVETEAAESIQPSQQNLAPQMGMTRVDQGGAAPETDRRGVPGPIGFGDKVAVTLLHGDKTPVTVPPLDIATFSLGVMADKSTVVPSSSLFVALAAPETPRLVAQQLVVAITQHSGRRTDIALNPEELGRVRMNMSISDGALMLQITTERPETADLLRRHIDTLAQEFRALGYSSIKFSFGEDQSPNAQQDAQTSVIADDLKEDVTSAEPETLRRKSMNGSLDLRL